ncbi:glycosyltransferase family 2 protein [Candidatus Woesearchaeota archaeon]|nr:glycosyltransferase family 2 protein [Candidatus Woesearchaeota archaeon]
MAGKVKLSVIVACYNEEKNIAETIRRVHKTVPDAEIVVVDDGSKDATAKIAKEACRKLKVKKYQVIRYTPNKGKGNAIKVGVEAATGEIQAQVDADSQFPPEELPRLIKPILDGKAELTFASRFVKGSTVQKGSLTRMRRLANYVVSGFTSVLAGTRLTDVNAGFKAWKTDAIRKIDFNCAHFGYEPEIAILAKEKGYRIVEVPVNYKGRQTGISNVKLLRDGVIIPYHLLKVKFGRRGKY